MASLGNVVIILEDEMCLYSFEICDSPNQKAEFKKKQQESVKAEGRLACVKVYADKSLLSFLRKL